MGAQAIRQPGPIQGIVLLLPITMAVMGIVLLVPVLPEILHEFGGVPHAPYLVQLVLTLPAGCVLLFSPLAGWIADRHGRRRPLMIAMTVYALMGIAPIFLTNIWSIILSRVGVGVCEALIMTATTTMICDYFKGRARERWLASQTAVASLSALGLLQISGLLGQSFGWRGPFSVYLFSLVLLLGIWRFTWEPGEDAVTCAGTGAAPPCAPGSPRPDAVPWPRLLGICALTVYAAIMFYTYQTQSGLALNALGVHEVSRRGTAAMIASLGVPLGTFLFWGAARLPIALLLCAEYLLLGLSYLSMGHAMTINGFITASFFNQLGCGMILPTMLTWATRGLSFQVCGRCTGWWTGSFAIGQFLSGLLVTLLASWVGGLLPAFAALGIMCLATAALTLLAKALSSYRPRTPTIPQHGQ
jgi:predicted MFS family arabinose efflux permease